MRTPWGKRLPVSSGGVVSMQADILLDFVNNVYRVDGTTYATAALAGWTGTGTFDANGYTAASGQRIVNTIDLGANFIVTAVFDNPTPMAQDRVLWAYTNSLLAYQAASTTPIGTFPATTTYSGVTLLSAGVQGGVMKASGGGSAVTTGAAATPPGAAAFGIGNFATGVTTSPWGVPIKKIAIYKQTLTNAQIQGLT